MRMENGTAILEDSLVVSNKTKYTLPIRSCSYAFWYLSKGTENSHSQKPAHRRLQQIIHNCQNLEATKMSSVGG